MIILDEQLAYPKILAQLPKRLKVRRLVELRPNEKILDDRVPEILLQVKQPTFATIDRDFWSFDLCHPGYCILYFALADDEQWRLCELLPALLRLPEFHTHAARMGKVARVTEAEVHYWQVPSRDLRSVRWEAGRKR
jgi:hypothetical protein